MKLSLIVLALCLAAVRASAQQDPSAMEQDMLRLVNQERAQAGLPLLHLDARLTAAARAHSQLMADRKKLAHVLEREPDLSERVAATGLRFNAVAENISAAFGSDQSPPSEVAHRGLMGSPPHRANILNPDYNSIGIGVAREGKTYYTTEDFAKSYADASTADVAKTVAAKVNELRRHGGEPALRIVPLDRLSTLACADKTSVQTLLQSFASSRSAAVYTTWIPSDLPRKMIDLAQEQGLTAVSLHVCTLPPAHGGSGGFKVAAVFF
jgi:uncharacterized protein YkwD